MTVTDWYYLALAWTLESWESSQLTSCGERFVGILSSHCFEAFAEEVSYNYM